MHFDLAGFEILFQEPSRLPAPRRKLEKRVARRRERIA